MWRRALGWEIQAGCKRARINGCEKLAWGGRRTHGGDKGWSTGWSEIEWPEMQQKQAGVA